MWELDEGLYEVLYEEALEGFVRHDNQRGRGEGGKCTYRKWGRHQGVYDIVVNNRSPFPWYCRSIAIDASDVRHTSVSGQDWGNFSDSKGRMDSDDNCTCTMYFVTPSNNYDMFCTDWSFLDGAA